MRRLLQLLISLGAVAALGVASSQAANSLVWRAGQDRVDADLTNCSLTTFLRKLASATGWRIAYESNLEANISVKFTDQPEDEALRRLLGKFNFAKETTNGATRLLVFRTVARAATQAVAKDYLIPNELLVKLKRNSPVTIEELARQLHAKIIGRDDRIGLYRLQFDDEAGATAAMQELGGNNAVAAVAHNYSVDPPDPSQFGPGGASPASLVNPKAPAQGGLMIGLIDTAIQPQPGFEKYMLPAISVVGQADVPTTEPSHATAMMETIVQAMADDPSMIQPVVIYKDGEQTTTFQLIEGILAAVNAGANPINLSLGGTGDSDMLHSLIDTASQKGVVFVAASGNTPGGALTYPAAYPDVLSVTALDPNGQLAPYADNFPGVKTSAPGTSYVNWNGQTWIVQGTSGATADVTGQISQTFNQTHTPLNQIISQWIPLHPAPH